MDLRVVINGAVSCLVVWRSIIGRLELRKFMEGVWGMDRLIYRMRIKWVYLYIVYYRYYRLYIIEWILNKNMNRMINLVEVR